MTFSNATYQSDSAARFLDSLQNLLLQMLWSKVLPSIHSVQKAITEQSQLLQLVDELHNISLVEPHLQDNYAGFQLLENYELVVSVWLMASGQCVPQTFPPESSAEQTSTLRWKDSPL